MDLQNDAWFSNYTYLHGMPLQPFQKSIEKLVHGVLLHALFSSYSSQWADPEGVQLNPPLRKK